MSLAAVFQIGSLGDSLVSVPAMRSLRELAPDISEYLLITQGDGSQKVSPQQVFDMAWPCRYHARYLSSGPPLTKAVSIGRLLLRLRWLHPRYAVYLMPSDRTSAQVERDKRFARAAGIPKLLGFRTLSPDELSAGPAIGVERTEAFLRFRRLWGERAPDRFAVHGETPLLHPADSAVFFIRQWLHSKRRFPGRPLVAIAPCSNWQSRDLPAATMIDVARRLEGELACEVVFIGGAKDHQAVETLRSAAQSGLNTCGLFSLEQSAALMRDCDLLIGAESGPMHLAGALGTPTVIAYSRVTTELARWFALGSGHSILYRDVACAGCQQVRCPVAGHPCLSDIDAADIIGAAAHKLRVPFNSSVVERRVPIQEWDVPALSLSLRKQFESSPAA